MRNTFPDIKFIEDGMKPTNWNKIIEAVRLVSRYDDSTGKFGIPSLALKLCYSLVNWTKLLKTKSIIDNDDVAQKSAEQFSELYNTKWNERISSKSHQTLFEANFNEPKYVPLAEDVKSLNDLLDQKANSLCQAIKEEPPSEVLFSDLAEVCLT